MIIDWIKNLKTQEERDDFSRLLTSSTIMERLRELLTEYEKSLDRSELTEQVFDKPNWAERQAFKNGYRSCLSKMKQLVNLRPEE